MDISISWSRFTFHLRSVLVVKNIDGIVQYFEKGVCLQNIRNKQSTGATFGGTVVLSSWKMYVCFSTCVEQQNIHGFQNSAQILLVKSPQ